ncbi:hypothetical protein D3C81_1742440 [compost metagenome]
MSVACLTMGRNLARSCSRLVLFRYWVAASSGPARMPLASCTVIFFTASTSRAWACGTAASAAWFIVASSCSTWAPMPIIFMVLAALPSLPGSSMRTLGLSLKPPGLPSCCTATLAPWVRASLRPPLASCWLRSARDRAKALADRARPAQRAVKRIMAASLRLGAVRLSGWDRP